MITCIIQETLLRLQNLLLTNMIYNVCIYLKGVHIAFKRDLEM